MEEKGFAAETGQKKQMCHIVGENADWELHNTVPVSKVIPAQGTETDGEEFSAGRVKLEKQKPEMVVIVQKEQKAVSEMSQGSGYPPNPANVSQTAVPHEGKPPMNAVICIEQMIYNEDNQSARYKCRVAVGNNEPVYREVPAQKYQDGKWLYSIMGYLQFGDNRAVTSYLQQTIFQFQGVTVKETDKPGWVWEDNSLLYVTPQGTVGSSACFRQSISGQSFYLGAGGKLGAASEFLEMERLTPNSTAATVINLYTVLGFTSSLFRLIKMPLKFLLFLHGRSGVGKTSLALAMTQLENREKAQYSLKSTSAGLEAGFGRYKDAVMLMDDLCPSASPAEAKILEHNLELVTRCFGDGNGKMRCDVFLDKFVQFEAAGGAIITGEYVTGVESSLARSIFLPLTKGDVDKGLLTKVQNDDTLLARFLWGFFSYICENHTATLGFLDQRCKEYRMQLQYQYSNSRYAEYQAQLMTASDLLIEYCRNTGQLCPNGESLDIISRRHRAAIQAVVQSNEKALLVRSPITQLCNAIMASIETGSYAMAGRYDKPLNPHKTILEDEVYYYIPQHLIRDIMKSYSQMNGDEVCSIHMTAVYLSNLLAEYGVIASQTTGGDGNRNGKSIRINGVNVRYLLVIRNELQKHTAL